MMRFLLIPTMMLALPAAAHAREGAPAPCSALGGAIVPASAIGLPSGGASVQTATRVEAPSPFCRVTGQIAAANPADPPIKFQLNLPEAWNGKALQMGGGGFNGTVVDGLGRAPGQMDDAPTSLAQGYATYGSDSGHESPGFDGRFALNAQALANYSGESVKRLHDAAAVLIARHYGRAPRRSYYAGGSKGGQEGLAAAQRYGRDYDGVLAYYPAAQNQAMTTAWYTMWTAANARPGAALDGPRQKLLADAVLAACDGLDGAKDGIIANTQACNATFAINSLRCPGGAERDGCLSDLQIDALQVAATPLRFPFPMANGVTQIGPYPVYLGADMNGMLYGGADGKAAIFHAFFAQVWPYFVLGHADAPSETYSMRDHQARVLEISRMFDTSNPDLDAFRARGGKLILVQGTTDLLVPESMTTAYVDRLRQRYGGGLGGFLRYYLQPGYGHGMGAFQLGWDGLSALDAWVESGKAPLNPVATDRNKATAGRTMPLCEQPRFPRYTGKGDMRAASSYRCALPGEQ